MDATRAGQVTTWDRCYMDVSAVRTLMGLMHWGVRQWERETRAQFLVTRTEVMSAESREVGDLINRDIQGGTRAEEGPEQMRD